MQEVVEVVQVPLHLVLQIQGKEEMVLMEMNFMDQLEHLMLEAQEWLLLNILLQPLQDKILQ